MTDHDKEEQIEQAEITLNPSEDQEAKAAARKKMIIKMTQHACDENDEGLRKLAKD
jgi:hypothetical protein